MAALLLTLDKASYRPGDTITVTPSVTGLTPLPDVHKVTTITGTAVVDGAAPVAATATYDLATTPPHVITFNIPGFVQSTTNPLVWTGKA